jgi:hypothetical protein
MLSIERAMGILPLRGPIRRLKNDRLIQKMLSTKPQPSLLRSRQKKKT